MKRKPTHGVILQRGGSGHTRCTSMFSHWRPQCLESLKSNAAFVACLLPYGIAVNPCKTRTYSVPRNFDDQLRAGYALEVELGAHVMTMTPEQFAERECGLQLSFFEILWSAEDQLTHIFGRVRDGRVELHFAPRLPSEREKDCLRLALEVIDVAFPGQSMVGTFGEVPKDLSWRILMSQEIFQEIAKEVAPWRLQQGR